MCAEARRLSVCYAVPGHDLVASAGPTRNVLSLAESLAEHCDVTVAFRRLVDAAPERPGLRLLALDPAAFAGSARERRDDAAVRGMGVRALLGYLRTLRRFVDARADDFDVLLEKSWLLSGSMARRAMARGTPSALVENVVRQWNRPLRSPGAWVRLGQHHLVQRRVARLVRGLPILAETEVLRRALVQRLGVAPEDVTVVDLGVDHQRFRPADRGAARQALGIDAAARVLLYTGVLDQAHDLGPLVEALGRPGAASLSLHVLGDGEARPALERAASAGAGGRVVFHGRVPHDAVPRFVAASDLCVAPYDLGAFPGGEVYYSTLKIPEYMACARPVASMPSGNVRALIRPGVSGFLLPNDADAWSALLHDLPAPERLAEMGLAARDSVRGRSWEATAQGYLAFCEALLGRARP